MKKNKFIVSSAQQIFAGMMSNPEKDADASTAIRLAEDLWENLVEAGYVVPKKTKKSEE